ncbi:hypothetical protein DFH09DRAFT_1113342 [Mycena vulgaris]|nr:hypothetical protein DFH09DRAFT_1113342 [Mycena vulgaris]
MTDFLSFGYFDGLDAYFDGVMHPLPSGVAASRPGPAACPFPTRSTTEVNEATNLVSRASDFDSDLESAYPNFQNEYGDFPGDGAAAGAPGNNADDAPHAGHYLLGAPGFDLNELLADCGLATTY